MVFLNRTPAGSHWATGWGQGKYSVVTVAASGEERLRTNFGGTTLTDPVGKTGVTPRNASLSLLDATSLVEFKARPRDIVRRDTKKEGSSTVAAVYEAQVSNSETPGRIGLDSIGEGDLQ